jgi:hypothetical protein
MILRNGVTMDVVKLRLVLKSGRSNSKNTTNDRLTVSLYVLTISLLSGLHSRLLGTGN